MNNFQDNENKQSFIMKARRKQIIEASIKTLDEIGYVKTSLAQIAKRAGISTALISYHFANKNDLMNHLLMKLMEGATSYILERVQLENTPREKLNSFIVTSLEYQSTHPKHNTALIEIVFHARTPDDTPYYKLNDDDEDPILTELVNILRDGQDENAFSEYFNIEVMANMIQGAIGEYMFNQSLKKRVSLKMYTEELLKNINKSVEF